MHPSQGGRPSRRRAAGWEFVRRLLGETVAVAARQPVVALGPGEAPGIATARQPVHNIAEGLREAGGVENTLAAQVDQQAEGRDADGADVVAGHTGGALPEGGLVVGLRQGAGAGRGVQRLDEAARVEAVPSSGDGGGAGLAAAPAVDAGGESSVLQVRSRGRRRQRGRRSLGPPDRGVPGSALRVSRAWAPSRLAPISSRGDERHPQQAAWSSARTNHRGRAGRVGTGLQQAGRGALRKALRRQAAGQGESRRLAQRAATAPTSSNAQRAHVLGAAGGAAGVARMSRPA